MQLTFKNAIVTQWFKQGDHERIEPLYTEKEEHSAKAVFPDRKCSKCDNTDYGHGVYVFDDEAYIRVCPSDWIIEVLPSSTLFIMTDAEYKESILPTSSKGCRRIH